MATYAVDKNECNGPNRDETSVDRNKLGMTRKFMSSQATGNSAASLGE